MTIHYLDVVFYFIGLIFIYIIAPRDWKYEIGFLALFLVYIIYTGIYLILFVLCGCHMIDILSNIHFSIKFVQ